MVMEQDWTSSHLRSQPGVAHIKAQYLTTKEHFHQELHTYKESLQNSSGKASCKSKEDDDTPAKKICPEAVANAAEEWPPGTGTSTSQQETQVVGQLSSGEPGEVFGRPMGKVRPEVPVDVMEESAEAQDGVHEPIKTIKLLEIGETKGDKSDIKQKRARGQNKHRPHMKPSHYDDISLCSAFWQGSEGECRFGSGCRFEHDIETYLKRKLPDLGSQCPNIMAYGCCSFGLTCRFFGGHKECITPISQNAPLHKGIAVRNLLNRELQQRLRKHSELFTRADAYLAAMGKTRRGLSKSSVISSSVPNCGDSFVHNEPLSFSFETTANNVGSANFQPNGDVHTMGALTDEDVIRLRQPEKKSVDFRNKLYLAPLTTCGNLPFRRVCKRLGADITCGEMAMCTNLLQGQTSEWALLKRHHSEDVFGVQLEGGFPDTMTKCADLLNRSIDIDFVDINMGCPLDLVCHKGGGCALLTKSLKLQQIVQGVVSVLDVPLTVKMRAAVMDKSNLAHKLIPHLREWGTSMITLHGRSKEQRFTKLADWDYIKQCVQVASPVPLFGNGDIFSFEDANNARETDVAGLMLGRGALIKPWIFTEIKEHRHWDISSGERFALLKDFTCFGLEHWGSDTQGVEKTRRFLLEWLSFLCRYIPVGLLERVPQRINERPPYFLARDSLENLMASQNVADWITLSEMLLGPVPPHFSFLPKHKANSFK
uniref:tRNA-dihydrouridine(47) synthase [NAD(P)(+)]-like n=1 Tax=Myxine glutinosa TaxID=7769 RepID=UPI00359014CC